MSIDLTVPQWLKDYSLLWADRLGLASEWEIQLTIEHAVGGDMDVNAQCHCQPDINYAHIRFRADIEDTAAWRTTLIHELLHIKHGRIDHYLECIVFPETGDYTKSACYKGYCQHYESFTHSMAKMLYAMWAVKEADPDRVAKVPKRRK